MCVSCGSNTNSKNPSLTTTLTTTTTRRLRRPLPYSVYPNPTYVSNTAGCVMINTPLMFALLKIYCNRGHILQCVSVCVSRVHGVYNTVRVSFFFPSARIMRIRSCDHNLRVWRRLRDLLHALYSIHTISIHIYLYTYIYS